MTKIYTDKVTGIVLGQKFYKKGKVINGIEYYATTGQLKGYSIVDINGERTGPTKHYFENEQIKVIGKYSKNKKVGVWKFFDSDGYFILTEKYDAMGNLIETKEIQE